MEKREIEFELRTGKSEKDLGQLVDLMTEMNSKLGDVSKKADSIEEIGKGAKKSAGGIKGMLKNLTSVGNLFKASGVFFIAQKIFEALGEAFRNNQVYLDGFNIAGQMATKVIGDFTRFVFDNFGKVSDFFKSVFEDPAGMVEDLATALKENLQERLQSMLDMFGYLGDAAAKFFEGDFSGAMDSAKMAGSEFVDTMTGVDNTLGKVAEVTTDVVDAVVDYTTSTYNAAKAAVVLNKQAEISEALNQGLIEKYDIQAESLRQIRDDESKSIAERIKANTQLAEVLAKQQEEMEANAQVAVDAAKAQLAIDKNNQEAKLALIQAENELAAVKARVTGFASEQLTNENTLLREQKELMNELNLIGETEFERQRLEAEQELLLNQEKIEREIQDDAKKKEYLAAAKKQYEDTITKIDQEENAKRVMLAKAETDAKIDFGKQALGALQGLAKEGSQASKALAVGQTVLDAYKSINAVFANAAANPSTILFPGYPFVQAAIAGVNAFATVKKIMSVNPMQAQGSSKPTVSRGGAPVQTQSQAPAFNVVGASPENQLATAIGQKESQPVKAFVVSNDVTNAQALDRNIVESASLG